MGRWTNIGLSSLLYFMILCTSQIQGCDQGAIMRCVQKSQELGHVTNLSREQICGLYTEVSACFQEAIEGCPDEVKENIDMSLRRMADHISPMCGGDAPACDMSAIMQCSQHGQELAEMAQIPPEVLCYSSKFLSIRECFSKALEGCPEEMKQQVTASFYMIDQICDGSVSTTQAPRCDQGAIAMCEARSEGLATMSHLSPQEMCQSSAYLSIRECFTQAMSGCPDEIKQQVTGYFSQADQMCNSLGSTTQEPFRCNQEAVMRCVHNGQGLADMSRMTPQELCQSSAYHATRDCVSRLIEGCPGEMKQQVTEILYPIYATCTGSVPTTSGPTCDQEAIKKCVEKSRDMVKLDFLSPHEICQSSLYSSIKSCFSNTMEGCPDEVKDAMAQSLRSSDSLCNSSVSTTQEPSATCNRSGFQSCVRKAEVLTSEPERSEDRCRGYFSASSCFLGVLAGCEDDVDLMRAMATFVYHSRSKGCGLVPGLGAHLLPPVGENIPVVRAAVGESVTFTCSAVTTGPYDVAWLDPEMDPLFIDERAIKSGSDWNLLRLSPSEWTLVKSEVTEMDKGIYTCIVRSSPDSPLNFTKVQLIVDTVSGPSFVLPANTSTVVVVGEGDQARLSCRVKDLGNKIIFWRRSDETTPIVAGDKVSPHVNNDQEGYQVYLDTSRDTVTSHLLLNSVMASQAGDFVCEVMGKEGILEQVFTLEVTGHEPSPAHTTVAEEGSSVLLLCKTPLTFDNPPSGVIWSRSGQVLTLNANAVINDSRFSVETPSRGYWNLRIEDVRPSDQGLYTCTADPRSTFNRQLRVLPATGSSSFPTPDSWPRMTSSAPTADDLPRPVYHDYHVTLSVRGAELELGWNPIEAYRQEYEIKLMKLSTDGASENLTRTNRNSKVLTVQPGASYVVMVRATGDNEWSDPYFVSVPGTQRREGSRKAVRFPRRRAKSVTAVEGSDVKLLGKVFGLGPNATLVWTKPKSNNSFSAPERFSIETVESRQWDQLNLLIKNVEWADQGVYRCFVNTQPDKFVDVDLHVKASPRGLSDSELTPAPGPRGFNALSIRAVALTSNSVLVSAVGAGSVQRLRIKYTDGSGKWMKASAGSNGQYSLVPGLSPSTRYFFMARAKVEGRTKRATTHVVTLPGFGTSVKNVSVQTSTFSQNSLVTWDYEDEEGVEALGFVVAVEKAEQGQFSPLSSRTTSGHSAIIDGLERRVLYRVRVAPFDYNRRGAYTEWTDFSLQEDQFVPYRAG